MTKHNGSQLRALIKRAGITQAEAARLIGERRGYPLAERTVRSWLTDPALATARGCPDWAPRLLAEALRAGNPRKKA